MSLTVKAYKPITDAIGRVAPGFYVTLEGEHASLEDFLSGMSYHYLDKARRGREEQDVISFLQDSGRNVFDLHSDMALVKLRGVRHLVDDTYVLLITGQDRGHTDDVRIGDCVLTSELISLVKDWKTILDKEASK